MKTTFSVVLALVFLISAFALPPKQVQAEKLKLTITASPTFDGSSGIQAAQPVGPGLPPGSDPRQPIGVPPVVVPPPWVPPAGNPPGTAPYQIYCDKIYASEALVETLNDVSFWNNFKEELLRALTTEKKIEPSELTLLEGDSEVLTVQFITNEAQYKFTKALLDQTELQISNKMNLVPHQNLGAFSANLNVAAGLEVGNGWVDTEDHTIAIDTFESIDVQNKLITAAIKGLHEGETKAKGGIGKIDVSLSYSFDIKIEKNSQEVYKCPNPIASKVSLSVDLQLLTFSDVSIHIMSRSTPTVPPTDTPLPPITPTDTPLPPITPTNTPPPSQDFYLEMVTLLCRPGSTEGYHDWYYEWRLVSLTSSIIELHYIFYIPSLPPREVYWEVPPGSIPAPPPVSTYGLEGRAHRWDDPTHGTYTLIVGATNARGESIEQTWTWDC
jgi:hypothetical protein